MEKITGETEKAFCCIIENSPVWIPKSQIADAEDYEAGDSGVTISVTEFIAREKNLS